MGIELGSHRATLSFTRPNNTTAYTAGDVLGTSTSAVHTISAFGRTGGFLQIQSVRLIINIATVPSGMAGFRLHLYQVAPTAIVDNAAYDLVAADRDGYRGYVDLPTPQDFGSTLVSQLDYAGMLYQNLPNASLVYAQLQTLGGFTPGAVSEVYDLRLNALDAGYRSS